MPCPLFTFPHYNFFQGKYHHHFSSHQDTLSQPINKTRQRQTNQIKKMNCNNICLTRAFCNSTIFKSSKICFFSPKLSKFKSLLQIISENHGSQQPKFENKMKKWVWAEEYTSSLLSAFGPISTILNAFSKELTENPTNKGTLSSTDKP